MYEACIFRNKANLEKREKFLKKFMHLDKLVFMNEPVSIKNDDFLTFNEICSKNTRLWVLKQYIKLID